MQAEVYTEREADPESIWHRQTAIIKTWEMLSSSEKEMFYAVLKAWAIHQKSLAPGADVQLRTWITRAQIAAQYDTELLIPYRVKLLDRLGAGKKRARGLRWVVAKKRSTWRLVDGARRPAGFEWVYQPDMEIIQALMDHQAGKISNTPPLPRPLPRVDLAPDFVLPSPTLLDQAALAAFDVADQLEQAYQDVQRFSARQWLALVLVALSAFVVVLYLLLRLGGL